MYAKCKWCNRKVWKENSEDDGEHELNMTAQQYLEGCKTRFSDYDSQYNQWQSTLG